MALGDQGVQVFVADSGESGLHMLSQNNIDLVFLDVMLPGADGYQICKTIKKNRQKHTVPVIMLTSKASPFDRVKGSLSGCDAYLTKPVEFRKLIEVLDKFRVRRLEESGRDAITISGTAPARAI
jgi:twitching motility two-component system response regulator PilG